MPAPLGPQLPRSLREAQPAPDEVYASRIFEEQRTTFAPESTVGHPTERHSAPSQDTEALAAALAAGPQALAKAERAKVAKWAVILGIPAALIGACMVTGDDDTSFGSHSQAAVQAPKANIRDAKLQSDLNFVDVIVESDATLAASDYMCLNPFGGWCMPTSGYIVPVSTTGTMNITAPRGSVVYSIEETSDGEALTTVDLDTDMLIAEMSSADVIPSGESYGWAALTDFFGADDERHQLEEIADQFGEDSTLDACMDTVEQQGTALDAALAQGLREQFLEVAHGLEESQPEAAELLTLAGTEGSTFVINHDGNTIDITTEQRYKPGDEVTINGIKVVFGAAENCTLDPGPSDFFGDLAHDTSVTVVNDPRYKK